MNVPIKKQISPLICPCGQPLQLTLVANLTGDVWCIGHLESACSPLIVGKDLSKVMTELGRVLKEKGHFPTAAEYVHGPWTETPGVAMNMDGIPLHDEWSMSGEKPTI